MVKRNTAKLQRQVDAWNEKYQPGIDVTYTNDRGEQNPTKTRSYAEVLSGHTAVIWLCGVRGCYELSRVCPVEGI